MPIRYNGNEYDYDGDVYVGDNPVFKRPRRGVPITYWRHWYRSAVSNTDAIDLSIAVRRKSSEQDTVYIAYVSAANVLTVVSSPVKPYAYDMEWITEATISGVAKCSLAFDGVFRKLVSNDHIVFDTNSLPWLFYVTTANELKGGLLGGSYSTIVAEDVVSVDAVRSVSGYRGLEDKGLLCFYIVNGYLYYRQWLDNEWKTAIRIDDAPFDLVEVRANRTFDWRIALQLVDDTGMMHEIFTYPYYSGWVGIEFLTARATDITLDVHEISYHDLQSTAEFLTAMMASMSVDVLGAVSPQLYSARNYPIDWFDEEDNKWTENWGFWLAVKWTDQTPNVGENLSRIIITDAVGSTWPAQEVIIDNDFPNRMAFRFNDFNNAINPVTLAYADGNLSSGVVPVDPTSVEFSLTDLKPKFIPAPVVTNVWNVGPQKILIEFDMPILDIASQEGFEVTGFEPYYSPEGHLVPTEYEVDSITQEDVPTLYVPDFAEGVYDATVEDNGEIKLFAEDTTVNVLSFNGISSYVGVAHDTVLNPTRSMTIEGWVMFKDLKPVIIIGKGTQTSGSGGFDFHIEPYKGKIRFNLVKYYIIDQYYVTNIDFVLGEWHHFAAVQGSSSVSYYMDGVLIGSFNNSSNFQVNDVDVYIGKNRIGVYSSALIKDVRRWNIQRTAAEILENMDIALVGNESGLIGYWKLDEGTGTIAYDSTANSNDGTISNGTWTTEGGLGDYAELGTYTTEPYEIQSKLDLRLNWTSTEPEATEIKGYYTIDVKEPVEITWLPIDSGDVVEVGEDNIGKFVHVKMELSTEDVEVTPILESIWLEEAYPQANRVQINLTYDGRMKHPQGDITVGFTGSLIGPQNVAVDPFSEDFEPVIDPPWFNPADLEYITAKVTDMTIDVHEITHHDLQLFEPTDIITAKATDISVTVTYVGGGEIPL